MTISVLMSVYKSENGPNLQRAMDSIWTYQTLRPEQIVLIEDGPLTDELYAVIDEWKEKLGEKPTICKNEKNIGLTKSLNKGLAFVRGDLIARMDSDDLSAPTRFEHQRAFLKEHPEIAVVGGSMVEVMNQRLTQDAEGIHFDENNASTRVYPDLTVNIKKYICKASPLCHATVMMRTSMFKEGGIKYDERYITSQDIALWYDVVCAGYKLASLQEPTYYLELEDIIGRRSRKKAWNEFKIYMKGIRRLHGFTYYYIYPIARLLFRLMPKRMIQSVYSGGMRRKFLQKEQ